MFTPDSIVKAAGMLIALSVSSAAYGQAAPGQYGFGTDYHAPRAGQVRHVTCYPDSSCHGA